MSNLDSEEHDRIKSILTKNGLSRSYDDILVLKAYFLSLEFLRNLCSNMSPKQTEDLCRNMVLETYDYGSFVFKQGEPGEKFYVVLSGSCDIVTTHKVDLAHGESEVRERVIFTCKQGSHFGERALEYNEPRAASILCTQFTELVSINKTAYTEILRLNDSFDPNSMKPGSKAHIVKILAKARSKRTSLEIETCATYFERRIPFFENFNFEQLCELARVAECICVYGKQILFKQGQIGSAFYVSLSGKISVWVADPNKDGYVNNSDSSTSVSIKRDITDGLGKCVTILPEGTHFGERALENDDSKRMASVVTDEDLTELIIISKEDYNNLISVMLSVDNMKKVAVLRKTDLFSDLDVMHLNTLAKFMEAKVFKIDEVLFTAGTKAYELLITSSGECRVELNFEQIPNNKTKKDKKHKCNLGRLGPNTVLGHYVTQCGAPYVEVYHTETVIANSLLYAYSIGKNDFYQNFPSHTREIIINKIKDIERPILPYLWDNYPKQVGAEEWKRSKAWSNFRHDILNNNRRQNILENMKDMDKVKLAPNSGNIYGHTNTQNTLTNTDTKTTWTTVSASKDVNISSFGLEKPRTNTFQFGSPSFSKHKFIESALSRVDVRKSANFSKTHATNTSTESGSPVSKPKFEELPFCLIHIHREPIKYEANSLGFRRSLRVHMRVCGTVSTCSDAKDAASGLMRNAYLTLYHGDITRESELELRWKEFSGFDSMPLHETDHFFIYCRNAPLEYSSLSPSEDLLRHNYPAFCKVKGQNFGCLSIRSIINNSSISDTSVSEDFDTIRDPNTIKNTFPLFLLEVSALEEVLATTTTELECKNYATTILERRAELANFESSMLDSFSFANSNNNPKYSRESDRNTREGSSRGVGGGSIATDSTKFANPNFMASNINRRTCVVPMYDWFVVDDRTLSNFDINKLLLTDDKIKRTDKVNVKPNREDEYDNSREYALSRALKEYGLVSKDFKATDTTLLGGNFEEKSQILAPTFSLKVLDMEVATVSRKTGSNEKRVSSRSGTGGSDRRSSTKSVEEEAFDDPVKKLEKIKSLIDIRGHVLKLNDDLCDSELGRRKKKNTTKKNSRRNDSDSSDDDQQIFRNGTKTPSKFSGMGQIDKRIEIFDALSQLPIKSNSTSLLTSKRDHHLMKSASTPIIAQGSIQSSTKDDESLNSYDMEHYNERSTKKDNVLSMKLDVLESMLNRSKYISSL